MCIPTSRKNKGHRETRLWDIGGDVHDPLVGGGGLLELAKLSLVELDLRYTFLDDDNEGDENDTISNRK